MTATFNYGLHDAAKTIPAADEATIQAIAKDMEEHGFDPMHPILLLNDKIIDGRARLAAAKLAGIEPEFDYLDSSHDAHAAAIRANLHRRQLNEDQRAFAAARMLRAKSFVADSPQNTDGEYVADSPQNTDGEYVADSPQNRRGRPRLVAAPAGQRSRDIVAKQFKVSPRKVQDACVLLDKADEAEIEAIERGQEKMSKVAKRHKPEPRPRAKKKARSESTSEQRVLDALEIIAEQIKTLRMDQQLDLAKGIASNLGRNELQDLRVAIQIRFNRLIGSEASLAS